MMREGDGEIWASALFKIKRRAEGGEPVYEVQQIGRVIQHGNPRRSIWRNVLKVSSGCDWALLESIFDTPIYKFARDYKL